MNKILNIINYDTQKLAEKAKTYNVDSDIDVAKLSQTEKALDKTTTILIICAILSGVVFGATSMLTSSGFKVLQIISAVLMGIFLVIERILSLYTWSVFTDRVTLKQLKTADIAFYKIVKNKNPICYVIGENSNICTIGVTVEDSNSVNSQNLIFNKKRTNEVNVLTLDVLNKTVLEPLYYG